MHYIYETSCINSTAKAINDMVDQARKITWQTFRQHVHWTQVRDCFPAYSYQKEDYNPITQELTVGFHIKDDYGVSFHKSEYMHQPCCYIVHSAIEYIWIESD